MGRITTWGEGSIAFDADFAASIRSAKPNFTRQLILFTNTTVVATNGNTVNLGAHFAALHGVMVDQSWWKRITFNNTVVTATVAGVTVSLLSGSAANGTVKLMVWGSAA